jgi:hypothetical protein
MADWGEQAVFSVDRVDAADLDRELPVSLSVGSRFTFLAPQSTFWSSIP